MISCAPSRPYPGAFTAVNGVAARILRTRVADARAARPPAPILETDGRRTIARCCCCRGGARSAGAGDRRRAAAAGRAGLALRRRPSAPGRRDAMSDDGERPQLDRRGLAKSRIEALSDGIFAVAMTLLVLDIKSPVNFYFTTTGELLDYLLTLDSFAMYVISFFVLAIFWIAHHLLFHYVRHVDRRLLGSTWPSSCSS